jgi:hypothetical protein
VDQIEQEHARRTLVVCHDQAQPRVHRMTVLLTAGRLTLFSTNGVPERIGGHAHRVNAR